MRIVDSGQVPRVAAGLPALRGLLTLALASAGSLGAADFAQRVFPIFVRACVECHGPDQQMRSLRLDARESVVGGESAPSLVRPGDPEGSELYRRVAGLGDGPRMPMGGSLAQEDVEAIRDWIAAGAEWPVGVGVRIEADERHWAFVPPARAPVPQGPEGSPIDRFARARLAGAGLDPAPEADAGTLLRRLSLDLTGLPPTLGDLERYWSNPDYGALVDRLLASPHYGERWGRLWLDAARYADSDGYEKDMPREVWFYRDWVVDALNRDLPYDRFVIEQIAGDLLPGATQGEIVATGYLRNSMVNEEGGTDPEQFRMEALFDRMEAIGKGVLGLTIQCAQCHTHKYDPLTHEEYYRLLAHLNDADEAKVAVYTPDQERGRLAVLDGIRRIEDGLMRDMPDWERRKQRLERFMA